MKKVLILGGGFAGTQVAIDLQKKKKYDVTLVSNREFLFLFPTSIWLPVHGIKEEKVKVSLDRMSKRYGFNLLIDTVKEIKAKENKVVLEKQLFEYDYLFVAFGSDKMKPKGIENTFSLCVSPEQTLSFRDTLDKVIAKGSGKIAVGFGGNPKDMSAVRGGPAFETLFNLDYYLRKKSLRDNFELTMVAPMEKPGIKMGKTAFAANQKMLKAKNINTRFGKKITEFLPDGVVFEDGSKLASDIIMFISGGTGSSILKSSDLPLSDAGFVKINENCQVTEFPNVYAVGDAAFLEGPDWVAKQGHVAEMMASVAVNNLHQLETGGSKLKSYIPHLSIICVMDMGNGAAFIYRSATKEFVIPLPVVGHWMKKAWGVYARWTKLKIIPKFIK